MKQPKPARRNPQEELTGEITRSFLKHKIYGTVYAVETDEEGTVLASAVITEATACRHALGGYTLTLFEVELINAHIRDYEFFEPKCADATHLLDDIGTQERVCQGAESEWAIARGHAKACKETFEQEKAKLRAMVREATTPAVLPLFDARPEDESTPPDPPASDQPSASA